MSVLCRGWKHFHLVAVSSNRSRLVGNPVVDAFNARHAGKRVMVDDHDKMYSSPTSYANVRVKGDGDDDGSNGEGEGGGDDKSKNEEGTTSNLNNSMFKDSLSMHFSFLVKTARKDVSAISRRNSCLSWNKANK